MLRHFWGSCDDSGGCLYENYVIDPPERTAFLLGRYGGQEDILRQALCVWTEGSLQDKSAPYVTKDGGYIRGQQKQINDGIDCGRTENPVKFDDRKPLPLKEIIRAGL